MKRARLEFALKHVAQVHASQERVSLASTIPRRASANADQDVITTCRYASRALMAATVAAAVAREVLSSMMRTCALRRLTVDLRLPCDFARTGAFGLTGEQY